jgi:phospholipid transport system substrate-binding protein
MAAGIGEERHQSAAKSKRSSRAAVTRSALQRAAGLAALLGLLAIASPAVAAAGASTAAIKSANDSIRLALKKMVAARGTPGWTAARNEARDAVGTLLDFEALAKSTLGAHWDELKAPERTRYVTAMRSAMEANYLTRMQGKVALDEVKVDYLGEEPKGTSTLVHTHFGYGTDGAKLDFVMAAEKSKKPRAIDVITEEVSLAETYQEQIAQLWPKKGIDGVTAAFEKKAKRLEADLEAAQAAGGEKSPAVPAKP